MRRIFGIGALASLLAVAAPHHVSAFDVNPIVSVIELPEDQTGITLSVRNPRTVELPIIFEIVERTVHEDGSEDQTDAEDSFLVFPPQAVVPPGGSQAVRVQWIDAPPATSRSFTLFASEVPIDLARRDVTGVQTVFRIGASVHVVPRNARPAPVLEAAVPTAGGVRVTIANEGDRFVYVDDLSLSFGARTVAGYDLANIAQRTLIPPASRRSFVVPDVAGEPQLGVIR